MGFCNGRDVSSRYFGANRMFSHLLTCSPNINSIFDTSKRPPIYGVLPFPHCADNPFIENDSGNEPKSRISNFQNGISRRKIIFFKSVKKIIKLMFCWY